MPQVSSQFGWILAQAAEGAASADPFMQFMMTMGIPLIGMLLLFMLFVVRPERAERQKRQSMLDALKKNDRVQTIGGAIGVVADVSSDGKKVTLKFGDNTRIPFVRSAIQQVLSDESDSKPTELKS
jgi:preprotein translocase subunit YajC